MNVLEKSCGTWALKVNQQKKVLLIQKRCRLQGTVTNNIKIEQTNNFAYLGIIVNSTGSFDLAVKELQEKEKRAFYTKSHPIRVTNYNLD